MDRGACLRIDGCDIGCQRYGLVFQREDTAAEGSKVFSGLRHVRWLPGLAGMFRALRVPSTPIDQSKVMIAVTNAIWPEGAIRYGSVREGVGAATHQDGHVRSHASQAGTAFGTISWTGCLIPFGRSEHGSTARDR